MKLWCFFSKPRFNKEIYAKLQRNAVFEVSPVEVHFAGFDVAVEGTFNGKNKYKRHVQRLRIINISSEMQNMTVLPPQTEFFEIFYVKPVGQLSRRTLAFRRHFTLFSLLILTEAASARLCVGDPGRLQAQRVQILQ
jgi:hypothetical protein